MRLSSTFTLLSLVSALSVGACGDDGGTTPPVDAPIKDIGFSKPTATLKANNETAPDTLVEIGPANLACLNTPNNDVANTVEVTINTIVEDFQTGNLVPNTTVTVFANQAAGTPFPGGPYVSSSTGATAMTPRRVRDGYSSTCSASIISADGSTPPRPGSSVRFTSRNTSSGRSVRASALTSDSRSTE